MTDLPDARHLHRTGQWPGMPHGFVTLDYDGRFLRRKRLVTAQGDSFMVDLAETIAINNGDAFELSDGRLIEIRAMVEPVLVVTGDLTRLAWHIGNRHTPCQIEPGRLVIRDDKVLADMLRGLGATVTQAMEPFKPEGGAYGMGRTMGHEHGPSHTHGVNGTGE
jgi:urease accessory protein